MWKTLKNLQKDLLQLINEFLKVVADKINTQKSDVSLYTSSENRENEIKNSIGNSVKKG